MNFSKANQQNFRLKKRGNDKSNEVVKVLRAFEHIPNQYGDRFIPRRYLGTRDFNVVSNKEESYNDLLEIKEMNGFWRWPVLNNALKETVDTKKTLLNFHEIITKESIEKYQAIIPSYSIEPRFKNAEKLDWQCKPRYKPMAFVEAVHDLPAFNKSNNDLIDWSMKGQVVAIFNCKLVMWAPETNDTIEYNMTETKALAFSPSGDCLAIGVQLFNRPTIQIYDTRVINKKSLWKTEIMMTEYMDAITCFCWAKNEQYLLCGTHFGYFCLYDMPNLQLISINGELQDHSITAMKFSNTSKYLCITTVPSQIIIYLWNPFLKNPQKIWSSSSRSSKIYFDWHPWVENEMAIALSQTSISIFHVSSQKLVSVYSRNRNNCICFISALSFNKFTAELVVSFNFKNKQNEMLVLGSMDRVVDLLKSHEDIVYFMLWSPDGKKLATVGNDESLVLWNFFGNSERFNHKPKKPNMRKNDPISFMVNSIR